MKRMLLVFVPALACGAQPPAEDTATDGGGTMTTEATMTVATDPATEPTAGPTSDGPTSDGPTSDGPTSDGPTSEPTSDGPETSGTTDAPPNPGWQQALNSSGELFAEAIAVGPDGSTVIAGYHFGDSSLGGPPLPTPSFYDIYLAKYSVDGAFAWQRTFSAGVTPVGNHTLMIGVSVDPKGEVLLTGTFSKPTDFGEGMVAPIDKLDLFVARYTADGDPVWARAFGAAGEQVGSHVVGDAAGNTYVTGHFQGALTVGAPLQTPDPDKSDVLLFKLDPQGEPAWAQHFGGQFNERGNRVALTPDGDVVLLGEAYGSLDLGGGEVEIPCCTWSHFVARYGPDGAYQWATPLGQSSQYFEIEGLSVASDGSIYAGSSEVGLTKLEPGGAVAWTHALPDVTARDVAATPDGGVLMTGRVSPGTLVDFGDGQPVDTLAGTGALVRYDAAGALTGLQLFSALQDGDKPSSLSGYGVAVAPDGAVSVVYQHNTFAGSGVVDFGLGPIEGRGFVVHTPQ